MDTIAIQTPTKELVDTCAKSVPGQKILHDIGLETQSLQPPLTFVPWIIINGVRMNYW